MYVTRHSAVTDTRLLDGLWTLYRRSYVKVARETPTHEMLDRDEFVTQLRAETNRSWVVWDDGRPVGMALISTDVRATRWLSETYFEHHFPERFHSGLVHYVVWVTIDPSYAAHGTVNVLARQALSLEAREGALLVFDTPDVHQPHDGGGASELMIRLARMVGDAELLPLSTQRYFAVDFAAPGTNDSCDVDEPISVDAFLSR